MSRFVCLFVCFFFFFFCWITKKKKKERENSQKNWAWVHVYNKPWTIRGDREDMGTISVHNKRAAHYAKSWADKLSSLYTKEKFTFTKDLAKLRISSTITLWADKLDLCKDYHIPRISFYNYSVESFSCCSLDGTPSCLNFTTNRNSWTNLLSPCLNKIPLMVFAHHNHKAISFFNSYIKIQFNLVCGWRIPFATLDGFLISSLPTCLCSSKDLNICLTISIRLLLTSPTLTLFFIIHTWSQTIATNDWKFQDSSLFSSNRSSGYKIIFTQFEIERLFILFKLIGQGNCNDPRKSASHICAIPQKD